LASAAVEVEVVAVVVAAGAAPAVLQPLSFAPTELANKVVRLP